MYTTHQFFRGVMIAGLLASIGAISCSKKIDDAYLNPNAQVVEPIEQLLPSVIANFVGGANPGNGGNGLAADAMYIGRYVQYWAGNVAANQYDAMGGTTGNNGGALGYVWTMHYSTQGQNVSKIIEWGVQQQKWDYVGVAWAIRAWSWLTLSDEYGNIILREAFQANRSQFDYDTVQAEAYDTVRADAYRALSYLSMTGDSVSQTNLAKGDAYFFNGDVSKWKKFVYGVLARSYAHLSNKSNFKSQLADSVIKYANLSMTANTDNGYVTFANSGVSGTMNYFGPTRGNVGTLRQTAFVANLLNGNNTSFGVTDPRVWYLIREDSNGTFNGIHPTHGDTANCGLVARDRPQGFWGQPYLITTAVNDNNARYLFRNGAPFPIMTASEMQFLIAEAAYLKGDKATALTAYTQGISLDFDMLTTTYNTNVPVADQITSGAKAAYMSNPAVVPASASALTLSQIMLQKYIALYLWGTNETWVDMRKYHYNKDTDPDQPGVQVYTDWTPVAPADLWPLNGGNLVYRARPQNTSEYQYNLQAVTNMGGTNPLYCTFEEWFSRSTDN